MTDDRNRDKVHVTHCCARHGCKYGSNHCAVMEHRAEQEKLCEQCLEGEEIKQMVGLRIAAERRRIRRAVQMEIDSNSDLPLYSNWVKGKAVLDIIDNKSKCPFPLLATVRHKEHPASISRVTGWQRSAFTGEWCLSFGGSLCNPDDYELTPEPMVEISIDGERKGWFPRRVWEWLMVREGTL